MIMQTSHVTSTHQGQPTLEYGAPLSDASCAVVLLHGRGATAQGMLVLADRFAEPNVAFLAPQAAQRTWYPKSFLAPLRENEPALSSALQSVGGTLARVQSAGLPLDRVVLVGFSQGACLALEYAARHPQRYGGVIGFSGGLIGPPEKPFAHEGQLRQTPVLLGCSDQDPHIPLERVHDTAAALNAMQAAVDTRIYPGMGHTINDDELRAAREMVARVAMSTPSLMAPMSSHRARKRAVMNGGQR